MVFRVALGVDFFIGVADNVIGDFQCGLFEVPATDRPVQHGLELRDKSKSPPPSKETEFQHEKEAYQKATAVDLDWQGPPALG